MIFHDLFHDGETQAGSFRASRDIGLGQTLAAVRRQAFAVILNRNGNLREGLDNHSDMTGRVWPALGDSAFDRLDSVFEDVDQRLPDKASITAQRYRPRLELRLKRDLCMRR